MTRFLRFEVGGASALLWMLLFLSPYLNIDSLVKVEATQLLAIIFGSITLSIPLGNYLHQFTDAVFNPFARRRLALWPRAVIAYIEAELRGKSRNFKDQSYQAVLVFSKSYARLSKISRTVGVEPGSERDQEMTIDLKVEILREEIANRYSYYYARLENGAVAPVLGALFSVLMIKLFGATQYIRETPAFFAGWIVLVAVVGAVPILWRIPQLFRELDDLEVSLVALQRDCWPRVLT